MPVRDVVSLDVPLGVGDPVTVPDSVCDGDCVPVLVGEEERDDPGEGVAVPLGVFEEEVDAVAVFEGRVWLGDKVGVPETRREDVTVPLAVREMVTVAVTEGVKEGVGEKEGECDGV